jgi:hypothetical protein
MNNLCKYSLAISLIIMVCTANMFAQTAKKKTTRIRVEYFINHNKDELLVATLRVKEDRYVPLTDGEIRFKSIHDTTNILLDKIRTNENGEATLLIGNNSKIFKDSLGFMVFEVEYIGDNSVKDSRNKITVKQADLDISFFQKDSIKYIEVDVVEGNNQNIPVEDVDILFYIKGTFSLLNFGKEKTDKNGKVKIEFPIDMPGDTVGILTVVAKIEEDKVYGTIESRGVINWGIPVPLVLEKKRGLGDTDAPLWMVYTLIILLSIVWFNYLYVIYLIVKIKIAKYSKGSYT